MHRSLAYTVFLVPLLAAMACGDGWSPGDPIETTVGAVVSGTQTSSRPEVGSFMSATSSCTATLLSRRYFLTAAHCIDFGARVTGGTLFILNGSTHSPFEVDAVYSLGTDSDFERYDIAVGRLRNEVPASLAQPAVIADREPVAGESVTLLAYGCNVPDAFGGGSGGGIRRFRTFTWPPSDISCAGDSGGPYFAGSLGARGEILATVSGSHTGQGELDLYGLPGNLKSRIEALMRSLDDTIIVAGEPLETNTDRPGWDLPGMPTQAVNAANCRDQCVVRPECKAFTFVGNQPAAACWLKSVVPAAFAASNVTSGVVQRGLEVGLDRPGGNITSVSATGAAACRNACSRRADCRAFSFVNGGTCWLKKFVPRAVPNENVTSGQPSNQAIFDLPGSNLSGMPLPGHTAETCEAECGRRAACTAYTFTIDNGNCWLKSGAPAATNCNNCISGFRRSQENNVDRPGADLPGMPIQSLSSTTCETNCTANVACRAWTYVPSNSTCWLKGFAATPFTATNIVSGVRRGIEINTRRTGTTVLSEVDITEPVPEDCQKRCDANISCRSWTLFTKVNGTYGNVNHCVLWNQAGARSTVFGAYSGRRRMASF